jgi:hypothetical protein
MFHIANVGRAFVTATWDKINFSVVQAFMNPSIWSGTRPFSTSDRRHQIHVSGTRSPLRGSLLWHGKALAGLVASNGAVATDGFRGGFLAGNPLLVRAATRLSSKYRANLAAPMKGCL